jgi:hypothetical protein
MKGERETKKLLQEEEGFPSRQHEEDTKESDHRMMIIMTR